MAQTHTPQSMHSSSFSGCMQLPRAVLQHASAGHTTHVQSTIIRSCCTLCDTGAAWVTTLGRMSTGAAHDTPEHSLGATCHSPRDEWRCFGHNKAHICAQLARSHTPFSQLPSSHGAAVRYATHPPHQGPSGARHNTHTPCTAPLRRHFKDHT